MTEISAEKRRKGVRTVISLAILLTGFLVILLGMNFYEYFRAKNHFATAIITDINKSEVEKLRDFFNDVTGKLLLIHDLGKNGELSINDTVALNRKFIPFLENNGAFSGVILANENGHEYFLYRNIDGWVTRRTRVLSESSKFLFQLWKNPDVPVKKWDKTSDYDPRKRPWFKRPEKGKERSVYWSLLYEFYESKKRGVTASISWPKGKDSKGFIVFALDIPLSQVQQILSLSESKTHGLLFLLNANKEYYITSREVDFLKNSKTGSTNAKILSEVVDIWKKEGEPTNKFISVKYEGKRWLASLLPLLKEKNDPWVGFMAPENALLSDLKKVLFKIDVTDVVVALVGGMLLLLLFWKLGGLRGLSDEPVPDPIVRLLRYINEGESSKVEFKSTVRVNLRKGKNGKEIELAWLKALVAFLNSEGGALLIGVNDEGVIVGVEADNFENEDKCFLHIKNLINQHIGAEFSGFIQISLVETEDKTVVMIECTPARDPVFLKIGKNEEFYIRSGPSSVKLSPSQMISYVMQNMKKRG